MSACILVHFGLQPELTNLLDEILSKEMSRWDSRHLLIFGDEELAGEGAPLKGPLEPEVETKTFRFHFSVLWSRTQRQSVFQVRPFR